MVKIFHGSHGTYCSDITSICSFLKYFIIFFLDAFCEINISIYVSFKRDFLDHVLAYFKVLFYKIFIQVRTFWSLYSSSY